MRSIRFDVFFLSFLLWLTVVQKNIVVTKRLWLYGRKQGDDPEHPEVERKKEDEKLLQEQNERAGGAANVAANLSLLGIKTRIVGCVGDDSEAETLLKLMAAMHIDTNAMIHSKNRPTIAKTRILGGHQQMMRLDQESQAAFNTLENTQLLSNVQSQLKLNG